MAKAKDLTKKKFGKLLVIERDLTKRGVHWKCLCDCGNEHTVSAGALTSGNTRAFGETKSIKYWVLDKRCAVGRNTLERRLQRNWIPEDAVSLPPKIKGK